MRIIFAAAIAAAAISATPAMAQRSHTQAARQDCRHDLRNSDSRGEYRREMRDCRNDIQEAREKDNRDWRRYRNYDWNRPAPGQTAYWADDYYRDGRYYQERRLTRNDRIYRGRNGQYYCRRSDGTTGLIVGAAAGGLFGNAISNGRSSTIGTLLGAAVGATIGSSIDRGNVRCR
jgi:hypothetical protein